MPKSKVIPSTATLVTLAILASSNARPSRAQQVDCLSLESSTACPAFQNYYIGLAGLATRYPYLANVTDISSFDSSLKAYAFSSSDYLDALGCTGYSNDSSTPYARYSLSRLCAGLVQDTASSLPCNYQNNIAPAPLCQTTCNDWLASVTQITSDSSKCPNSSQRDNGMANLATQCANWQGYNGTASEGCIQGMANEPDNCGMAHPVLIPLIPKHAKDKVVKGFRTILKWHANTVAVTEQIRAAAMSLAINCQARQ